MVRVCCVARCPSLASQPSHRFPQRIELRKKWVKAISHFKMVTALEELDKCVVCHLHFKETDYEPYTYKLRKLKHDVVPSLNIPHQDNEPCERDEHGEPCEEDDHKESCKRTEHREPCEQDEHKEPCEQDEHREPCEQDEHREPCEQKEHREPCEQDEQTEPVAGPASSISTPQSTSTSSTSKRKATLSPMSKFIYDIGKKHRRNVRLKPIKLFILHKLEQQARRYAKIKAIQTLRNELTPMQREIFDRQVHIARYKPRVYKRMYLELAQARLLKKRDAHLQGLL